MFVLFKRLTILSLVLAPMVAEAQQHYHDNGRFHQSPQYRQRYAGRYPKGWERYKSGERQWNGADVGKYTNLLRVVYSPKDARRYGRLKDAGRQTIRSYAGYKNLPVGYWVYKDKNWYIFGKVKHKNFWPR
ncbi:MAG: hypothetical protein N2C14_28850 [Planctomycetales bacterium]